MKVIKKEGGVPIKMWTDGVPVEDAALEQLGRVSELPFIHQHVAVMPDVHVGKGATVGTVIATSGAIVPSCVGVDIGCGVCAVKTTLKASDLPDSLRELRFATEAAIPHGRTNNGGPDDAGGWRDVVPKSTQSAWQDLSERFARIVDKHPEIARSNNIGHLGTLGGGNHSYEICLDENQSVWIMLHSGSRGVGNRIGSTFIELARADMRRWFVNLPDADLAYLPEGTDHFDDYIEAVGWAQDYARENRRLMLENGLQALRDQLGRDIDFTREEAIQCHHNYVAKESHFGKNVLVTRKGACRAREGDLAIILGSMGTPSFIVRGKGDRDSFDSCSHGSGRVMSRTEARKRITPEEHALATVGVECRQDEAVLDESPAAYKDVRRVLEAQRDLVEVVAEIKQVMCIKG
jgi:tRNA-splicing ligase RtcB